MTLKMVLRQSDYYWTSQKLTTLKACWIVWGKNCKEVLMLWAYGYKMKEIANIMNYKSDNMAKKKKYKCFKELLEFLEQNPEAKSALRKW